MTNISNSDTNTFKVFSLRVISVILFLKPWISQLPIWGRWLLFFWPLIVLLSLLFQATLSHCDRCCFASSRAWNEEWWMSEFINIFKWSSDDGNGEWESEREPSGERQPWPSRPLAVWRRSALSQSSQHWTQSFQVSLIINRRDIIIRAQRSVQQEKTNVNQKTDRFTFWLCHQHVGVYLPFLIRNFIGRSSWADAVVPRLFVQIKLHVAPADLVEEPGLFQPTTHQGDLLFPAEPQRHREKRVKLMQSRWNTNLLRSVIYNGAGQWCSFLFVSFQPVSSTFKTN